MRGNWEAAEALVLAPGQQLQQQQHSIMEEQRLPLHSPTTPAWGGITDRIVVSNREPTLPRALTLASNPALSSLAVVH